jgi:threonine synthase
MSLLDSLPVVQGFRCEVCGAAVDIAVPMSWRCPKSTDSDRHHVLSLVQRSAALIDDGDPNPFLAFRRFLAWDAFAAARGLTEAARVALITELDQMVAAVGGTGFRRTPCNRSNELSEALGFSTVGGVWIKDETNNVAGSHKARHLFTTLLHLITLERLGELVERRPLAIASCGNAALAASTLAAAVSWPIKVFVPTSAQPAVLDRLVGLGAQVVICPRQPTDPPGDPCVLRFREALTAGAIPFATQGPENAWWMGDVRLTIRPDLRSNWRWSIRRLRGCRTGRSRSLDTSVRGADRGMRAAGSCVGTVGAVRWTTRGGPPLGPIDVAVGHGTSLACRRNSR